MLGARVPVRQDVTTMNDMQNQLSFTRAASKPGARPKTKPLPAIGGGQFK
jgi:hypothetical protein